MYHFLLLFFSITLFSLPAYSQEEGDFQRDYHKIWFSYNRFPELACKITKKTYVNEKPLATFENYYFYKKDGGLYYINEQNQYEYYLDQNVFLIYSEKAKKIYYKKVKQKEYKKYFRYLVGSEIEFKIKRNDSIVYNSTNGKIIQYTITNHQNPVSKIIFRADTLADVIKELHYIYFREKKYISYTYQYIKNDVPVATEKVQANYNYTLEDKAIKLHGRFDAFEQFDTGKKKKKRKTKN